MASPVGHTLGGLCLYLLARGRGDGRLFPPGETALVVLASIVPDLDFLPGMLLGNSSQWHHRITHSLFFALLVSVCITALAVLIRKKGTWRARRVAWLVGGPILLHIAFDLVTRDTFPPIGMQLFWPFSQAYVLAPWQLLESVHRGPLSWNQMRIWAVITVREAVIFAPPLAAIALWKKRRSGTIDREAS